MSNESWLHALRSNPSPLFDQRLRQRLRVQDAVPLGPAQHDESDSPTALESRPGWPRRTFGAAAAVAVIAALIAVPGVRASVAQFLSLFRVVHFVPVAVDSNRLDRLQADNLEIDALIGEHVEMVEDPGPPVSLPSVEDAASAAGMTLALPKWLPENSQVIETAVMGERIVRITADGQRLQQVLDALAIDDLAVPPGLDGQIVNVRVPPVVMIRYEHGNRRTRLFQARTPQLTLPQSVDVQALGEIGLRILGLPPAEATQFARAMDWNTTFIVPVPPTAQSFRQVNINGRLGVHIEHRPPGQAHTHVVLWSTGDRVLAMVSIASVDDVLAMANTVQ